MLCYLRHYNHSHIPCVHKANLTCVPPMIQRCNRIPGEERVVLEFVEAWIVVKDVLRILPS